MPLQELKKLLLTNVIIGQQLAIAHGVENAVC
jgi:hypothetical protein